MTTEFPADPGTVFEYNKRQEGWRLIEDIAQTQSSIDGVELLPSELFVKRYQIGERWYLLQMLEYASKDFGIVLGQKYAEWLLHHEDKIPESWRQYRLNFLGTIWYGDVQMAYVGYCRVPRLTFKHGCWHLTWPFFSNCVVAEANDALLVMRQLEK